MPMCAVFGCNTSCRNQKEKNVRLFTFPKKEDFQKQWVNACRRKDPINVKYARICSLHFTVDAYMEKPLMQKLLGYSPRRGKKLKDDAIPTIHLPCSSNARESQPKKRQLRDRQEEIRKNHEVACSLLSLSNSIYMDCDTVLNEETHRISETIGTPDKQHDIDGSSNLFADAVCERNSETLQLSQVKITEMENEIKNLGFEVQHYKILSEQLSQKIDELQLETLYYKNLTEKQNEEIKICKAALDSKLNDVTAAIKEGVEKVLGKVFTEGQIKLLLSDKKRIKEWSSNDIASAISLRSVSPKAYRYLRRTMNFPLPGTSTLCRYAATFSVTAGLQGSVLQLMKMKGLSLSNTEKITALSFDEMYLSPQISFDRAEERILGPHKTVQVVMARGLCSEWKQPLFYEYDFNMTVEQLFAIISALHDSGYDVVSTTCDMGTSNLGLWKQLQVTHTHSTFSHCVSGEPIAVFADVPHAIKFARNHFIDHGFVLENGQYVGKSVCESLINAQTAEYKIAYKISKIHLDVKGAQRQKVRLATQLFSNNVSAAIEFCGMHGLIPNRNWQEGAATIKLFNDWFDIHNSSKKYDKCQTRNAFGINLDKQHETLAEMDKFIEKMRVHKKNSMLPFQKGILMSNMSLRNLHTHLVSKYGLQYILTRRLNQDVLENSFSYLRGIGGSNDHPNALSFKHRLRWYVIGKHSKAIFTDNKNTEDNGNDTCLIKVPENMSMTSEIITNSEIPISEDDFEHQFDEDEIATFDQSVSDINFPLFTEDYENLLNEFELHEATQCYTGDILEEQGLRYVAGYVAHRFHHKCPNLSNDLPPLPEIHSTKYDWITFISKGKLTHPSDTLINIAKILEFEFNKFHGKCLKNTPGVIKDLVTIMKKVIPENLITEDALKCLIRTRTFIRIRTLNKNIRMELEEKRNKRHLKKFTS